MASGKENMGSKFVTFDQQSRQLNLGKHCVGAKSQVSPNWEIPQRLEKLLQDFTSLKLLMPHDYRISPLPCYNCKVDYM